MTFLCVYDIIVVKKGVKVMVGRYVELNSAKFESFLKHKGFVRETIDSGKEIVYSFCHEYNPNVRVKVYTSIVSGAKTARSVGKDAIRIVCIFDDGSKSFGIAKMPRVYRTGNQEKVEERTLERMREAYRCGSRWIRNNKNR